MRWAFQRETSVPRKTTRPPAVGTRPVMALRVEVLPAPLGPMIATTSPSATSSELPSTAVTLPERTARPLTSSSSILGAQVGLDHRRVRLDVARHSLGDPHPV